MHLDAFDYPLPPELIAQQPAEPRDASRLLALDRATGAIAHHTFRDVLSLLAPGDLLVMNDTRVVAARLVGRRERTGGRWEGLFVRVTPGGAWELLTQTRGTLTVGETLLADPPDGGPPLRLVLEEKTPGGRWLARPEVAGPLGEVLARFGQVPIPPYIRQGRASPDDVGRYQTVYARQEGAIAAPTAGLHFTPELLAALEGRGVRRAFVTLHVGPGTFQPVKVEDVSQHRVEPEWGEVPDDTAHAVAACKAAGGRVIAVGTTTTRVLERAAPLAGGWSGLADLTIVPPYSFRVIDGLITNFHLPRSSLLLLVAAFAGYDTMRAAYAEAVREQYRFYSYGDAMFIR